MMILYIEAEICNAKYDALYGDDCMQHAADRSRLECVRR